MGKKKEGISYINRKTVKNSKTIVNWEAKNQLYKKFWNFQRREKPWANSVCLAAWLFSLYSTRRMNFIQLSRGCKWRQEPWSPLAKIRIWLTFCFLSIYKFHESLSAITSIQGH